MRSNIPRRLRQLEPEGPYSRSAAASYFSYFCQTGAAVSVGPAECDGQVWERMPRETPQDFERRVMESLQRREHCPTVVIFFPERESEARRMAESAR